MTSTLTRIILFSFLLLLFIPHPTSAETKTFIKEYTYQASEDDSRNSSRTLALREVKRLLLEELGTYLESVTEVQNFQLTKDRITALTAGIVQTEIMADKWDGDSLKYWLKAKIVADSDEVIKSIDALRNDRTKTKELEEIKRRSDELLRENQRLRKELSAATVGQKPAELAAYNKTIKDLSAIDWEERSYALAVTGKNEGIKTFNKFIELNPQNAKVIYYRGLAYANIGDSQQAIKDYSKPSVILTVAARKMLIITGVSFMTSLVITGKQSRITIDRCHQYCQHMPSQMLTIERESPSKSLETIAGQSKIIKEQPAWTIKKHRPI